MRTKELYEFLASQGIRIFVLSLGSDSTTYIHHQKTVNEWRSDIRGFISEISHLKDKDGFSDDDVYNAMTGKLSDAGYIDIDDVASDVFEGRIAVYSAGIEDAPAHDGQAD